MNKTAFSKIGIIGIIILLAIIAIVGYYWWPGSKATSPEEKTPAEETVPEKKETPTSASFGERLELLILNPEDPEKTFFSEGIFLTVNEPHDFADGDEYLSPKKGSKFIAIQVKYENEWEDFTIVRMDRFHAIDPSGNQYDSERIKLPALSVSKINPGNSFQGYITYEVPESIPTSSFCIQYTLIRRENRTVDFCGK